MTGVPFREIEANFSEGHWVTRLGPSSSGIKAAAGHEGFTMQSIPQTPTVFDMTTSSNKRISQSVSQWTLVVARGTML